MRIGPAANVARLNVDETVTALWTFSNVLGLLTDIIGERTPGAGVTIDGVLLRDTTISLLGFASPANRVYGSNVLGDLDERFRLHAGGTMQWGDGGVVRDTNLFRSQADRLATDDELSVAGTLGLLTDIISELTGGVGVTIDGLLVLDTQLRFFGLAADITTIIQTRVTGDVQTRLLVQAGGQIEWGDGALARDTNLFRAAANELATDDDFNVGGDLDLAGDIEFSSRDATLVLGDNDDVDTGAVTIQRFTTNAGGSNVTGFAGGRAGRLIIVTNIQAPTLTLAHNDAGSVAANRLLNTNAATVSVVAAESVAYFYDPTSARWKMFANAT